MISKKCKDCEHYKKLNEMIEETNKKVTLNDFINNTEKYKQAMEKSYNDYVNNTGYFKDKEFFNKLNENITK